MDFLTGLFEADYLTFRPDLRSLSVALRTFLDGLPVLLLENDFLEMRMFMLEAKLLRLLAKSLYELFPDY